MWKGKGAQRHRVVEQVSARLKLDVWIKDFY